MTFSADCFLRAGISSQKECDAPCVCGLAVDPLFPCSQGSTVRAPLQTLDRGGGLVQQTLTAECVEPESREYLEKDLCAEL